MAPRSIVSKARFTDFNSIEMLVIAIVIISAISLTIGSEKPSDEKYEIGEISGTLNLATRDSMDSLGLEDFKTGATADVDLKSWPIESKNCSICQSNPIGVMISGEVNVTNLKPIDSGGTIRIEGKLNVTHFQEFDSNSMILREWLMIDWDLAEFSTQWDIFIEHNPPKWSPADRYDASYISTGTGSTSRAGPVINVETLLSNVVNVQGCLPNSMNCDGENRLEMNLTSTFVKPRIPISINNFTSWNDYSGTDINSSITSNIVELRNLFDTKNQTMAHIPFCTNQPEENSSVQSWEIDGDSTIIAPMNIWLTAIGLPSSSFATTNGIWTEIDIGEMGCGSFTDDTGNLILAISKI